MNNPLSPQPTDHKKDHKLWRWKFRSWNGTKTKYCEIKPVHDIPTFHLMIIDMLALERKRKAHQQNYKNIILN